MSKIFAERNFFLIFEVFDVYFLDLIRARNWGYLLHADNFTFYVPRLVQEFYDGFTLNNVEYDHCIIELT